MRLYYHGPEDDDDDGGGEYSDPVLDDAADWNDEENPVGSGNNEED